MDKSKKSTYIIAAVTFVVLILGIYFLFIFKKTPGQIKPKDFASGEIKQVSDIDVSKRPYVTLTPTSDGAEIIISIENMADFDGIEYELTYQADNPTAPGSKIQRGSTGAGINTKDQKYKTSILLGTASRGVRSPDRGVVDGILTMHLFKGDQEYLSETNWDLFQAGAKKATIESRDSKFQLEIPGLGKDYWVILADTIGVPLNAKFDLKKVQFPVFGAFSIAGDFASAGTLTIKSQGGNDLYSYSHQDGSFTKLDTVEAGSDLTAKVSNLATYIVVSSK